MPTNRRLWKAEAELTQGSKFFGFFKLSDLRNVYSKAKSRAKENGEPIPNSSRPFELWVIEAAMLCLCEELNFKPNDVIYITAEMVSGV